MKMPSQISCLIVLLVFLLGDRVQGMEVSEYELKAMFVYNLARMVEWPPESLRSIEHPLIVCLLGEAQLAKAFDAIRHRKVRRHSIEIVYYSQLDNEVDISNCHLMFIQNSEVEKLDMILSRLSQYSILTVSDIQGFAEQGGMMTLAKNADQRIRLEINRNAAQQANLHISARLLALARLVDTLE